MKVIYEVGDILHTTNGDFLIISIDSHNNDNNNKELFGYGAVYLDDENNYPVELQLISKDIDEMVKNICGTSYKIISVSRFDYK